MLNTIIRGLTLKFDLRAKISKLPPNLDKYLNNFKDVCSFAENN